MAFAQIINFSTIINAGPSKVWNALTDARLIKQWMSETEIDIITNWTVGDTIIIKGDFHEHSFENKGVVLQFETEHLLKYNHLSSLSMLADEIENYTEIEFTLIPGNKQTTLALTLSNFPTETIYKHFEFYWGVTLEVLKKYIENLA
jgi:uncharacterized protein YndB with AHSA1/START domain